MGEEVREVNYVYYRLRHLFPVIEFSYTYGGQQYLGSCGGESARRYEVRAIDLWGTARSDDDFFWRQIQIGDAIPLDVNQRDPRRYRLGIRPSSNYYGQIVGLTLAATVIAAVFMLAFLLGRN